MKILNNDDKLNENNKHNDNKENNENNENISKIMNNADKHIETVNLHVMQRYLLVAHPATESECQPPKAKSVFTSCVKVQINVRLTSQCLLVR